MKREFLVVFSMLLVIGCTVGPNYRRPVVAMPSNYRDFSKTAATTALSPQEEEQLGRWWEQFDDPELESLIRQALRSNIDILTAMSRIREARAQEVIARAAGLPQVSATAANARLHSNSNISQDLGESSGSSQSSGDSATPSTTNIKLYSAGFDATWELDIFGGTRRRVEAAQAMAEAAVWRMRDVEVSLTAEIASDYLALRTMQERSTVLKEETRAQRKKLRLIEAQHLAGFVTLLEVNEQRALVAATEAEIPQVEANVSVMAHAIAVLLAQPPEALSDELERSRNFPVIPEITSIGLPSDLLRRRPDIRMAERQLASATAQIGVAVADLYPKFDLLGAIDFTGDNINNLFAYRNLGEFGLGSIAWPLFNGGRIRGNIHVKKEERDQAYFNYQQSVLNALRETEDALAEHMTEQRRLAALKEAAAADTSSENLAFQQYRAGLASYLNVLVTQSNELSVRDQLLQSQNAVAQNLISVYKAIGGGW